MRKLTLDLDALQVASFEPGSAVAQLRGTIEAREFVDCPYTYCASCTIAYGCTWGTSCRAQLPGG